MDDNNDVKQNVASYVHFSYFTAFRISFVESCFTYFIRHRDRRHPATLLTSRVVYHQEAYRQCVTGLPDSVGVTESRAGYVPIEGPEHDEWRGGENL